MSNKNILFASIFCNGELKIPKNELKKIVAQSKLIIAADGGIKHFDYVKFTHAYDSKNPFFICEFNGLEIVKNVHIKYSTGFEVNFEDERWAIKLGEIVLAGNIKNMQGVSL